MALTYYTYNEEIRDEDVPEEVIVKKHRLPQLPEEIVVMILYKFGGLQHKVAPMLKMVRELTFKSHEDVLSREKRSPDLRIKYKTAWGVRDKQKELFKINECRDETTTIYRSVIYQLVGHIIEDDVNGQPAPVNSYTYDDLKYISCCQPRVGDSNIKYKNSNITEIIQYWKPHLVCKIMSVKQLKELLDMNEIYYPKSASKKKLLEAWYGFKEW